ncbi:MAG: hypothetical protein V9822_00630 [Candidatus Dasytiphilus stammeri]
MIKKDVKHYIQRAVNLVVHRSSSLIFDTLDQKKIYLCPVD